MPAPIRILHLEDDPADADLIRSVLESNLSVEIAQVHSREAFVAALEKEEFDLILSDYALPSFDGVAALAIWREKYPDLPFIFVSGTMGEELAVETLKAGATDYVLKDRLARLAPSVLRALEEASDRQGRREAERATVERTTYLNALIENSPIAILWLDADHKVRMINPAFERLFVYRQSEIEGTNVDDFIAPFGDLSRAEVVDLTRRVLSGETVHATGARRRKDGANVEVEVYGVPLMRDGQLIGIFALYNDITELKRAETSLREAQQFLRQIIDADPNLVFVKDWDGKFTLANRAVAEIYGTTPEALVGKTDADFNANREEVENFLRDDREVMTTLQKKFIPEELVSNAKTGETRWFHTVKVPLVSPDGKARQVLGVATDITQHRNLESQLRQSQKMEAIGKLAGGVAHDFNNLLTSILGYSDLVLEQLGQDNPLREDVTEIKKAGERAAALTRQLLAFSRKQILKPVVVDINAVVANIEKMLRRLIGENIDLKTTLDPSLGSVKADPGQIEQVILNLAVNARDAMSNGGRLTIETANVLLDENYTHDHVGSRAGRHVMLAVSDSGHGMDAETRAHIFEPFFTTKELGKGTGLGLSTVYGIVKQSDGYISVYSEQGKGTSFKVYLPRVDEVAARPAPKEALAPSRSSETILLVEDEDGVRALARRVLETNGYTVLEACDGETAVQIAGAQSGAIHLMLTDALMPGITGPELARRVCASRPGMKVIFMSGYTDEAVVRHGLVAGGTDFIQKPFEFEALARKVRAVLDRAQDLRAVPRP